MGIIEKKALEKIRGKRSACMKRECRKGNKMQLQGTWKSSYFNSGSVFPQIWGEVGPLYLKRLCETCLSKL